jgi:hypothetical protein
MERLPFEGQELGTFRYFGSLSVAYQLSCQFNSQSPTVPVGNSHSYVLVVKPAQDGYGQRLTDGLDGAGDRCILVR